MKINKIFILIIIQMITFGITFSVNALQLSSEFINRDVEAADLNILNNTLVNHDSGITEQISKTRIPSIQKLITADSVLSMNNQIEDNNMITQSTKKAPEPITLLLFGLGIFVFSIITKRYVNGDQSS
ncbi:MAG: PEP-CTERM sorting domain-containing protein [Pseudomonadota bacterium]